MNLKNNLIGKNSLAGLLKILIIIAQLSVVFGCGYMSIDQQSTANGPGQAKQYEVIFASELQQSLVAANLPAELASKITTLNPYSDVQNFKKTIAQKIFAKLGSLNIFDSSKTLDNQNLGQVGAYVLINAYHNYFKYKKEIPNDQKTLIFQVAPGAIVKICMKYLLDDISKIGSLGDMIKEISDSNVKIAQYLEEDHSAGNPLSSDEKREIVEAVHNVSASLSSGIQTGLAELTKTMDGSPDLAPIARPSIGNLVSAAIQGQVSGTKRLLTSEPVLNVIADRYFEETSKSVLDILPTPESKDQIIKEILSNEIANNSDSVSGLMAASVASVGSDVGANSATLETLNTWAFAQVEGASLNGEDKVKLISSVAEGTMKGAGNLVSSNYSQLSQHVLQQTISETLSLTSAAGATQTEKATALSQVQSGFIEAIVDRRSSDAGNQLSSYAQNFVVAVDSQTADKKLPITNTINTLVQNGMLSLGQLSDLSDIKKIELTSALVDGAVNGVDNLNSSSLPDMQTNLKQIAKEAMASVDDLRLAELTSSKTASSEVINSILVSAGNGNLSVQNYDAVVKPILVGALEGVASDSNFNLTQTQVATDVVSSVVSSAASAVTEIKSNNTSTNNAVAQSEVLATVTAGAIEGMQNWSVPASNLVNLSASAAQSTIAGFQSTTSNVSDISTVVKAVTEQAVSSIDVLPLSSSQNKEAIVKVSEQVTSAILNDASLTEGNKSTLVKATVEGTVSGIGQNSDLNISSDLSTVVNSVVTGAVTQVQDLATAEGSAAPSTALVTSVVAGANLGLGDLVVNNSNNSSGADATVATAVTSQLSNLQQGVNTSVQQTLIAGGTDSQVVTQIQNTVQTNIVADVPTCPSLTSPVQGFLSTNGNSYGSAATYTCQAGYNVTLLSGVVTSGTLVRVCGETGQWSGAQPSCLIKTCGDAPLVAHSSASGSGNAVGATRSYSCYPGYRLTTAFSTVTCNANATWSTSPVCSEITGPFLSGLGNSEIVVTGNNYVLKGSVGRNTESTTSSNGYKFKSVTIKY
jgi:hypothetical protein